MYQKPKRIILFFSNQISLKIWKQTGIYDREIKFYKTLKKKGYEILFVTHGDKSDYKYQNDLGGIKILPLFENIKKTESIFYNFILGIISLLRNKKKLYNYDIIKTNQIYGGHLALICKFLINRDLIVRSGYEPYLFSTITKKNIIKKVLYFLNSLILYKLSNKIITTSFNLKKYISRNFFIDKKKIKINPNYIDTKLFRPIKIKKSNKILMNGRLSKEKNYTFLFELLKKEKFKIDIIGDGPEKKNLKKMINKNKLHVKFLGKFPNNKLAKIYNRYNFFLMFSKVEGNPKTLLEAMACEMLVIGSNVEGVKNIIKNNINGFIVNLEKKSLISRLNKVHKFNKKFNNIRRSARNLILEKNSLESSINREVKIYSYLNSNAKS